jgi:hypothetical protein
MEPDSPEDVAIWMMQRAIANRTKLAIAQKERLGKHLQIMLNLIPYRFSC